MLYDIPLKSNFLASYELQEFMLTSSESQFSMMQLIDWLIGASLSSYHEKATVRYVLDESAPA